MYNKDFFLINDLKYLIPELFLSISLFLVLIIIVFFSNVKVYKYTNLVYITISQLILILIIYILLNINNIDINYLTSFHLFYQNNMINFYKIILSIIFALLLMSSYEYIQINKILFFEFYIILFFSFLGIILLLLSFDFISSYLSLELQSLCLYILIALNNNKNSAIEASLKYFILGAFSSSLFLLGIAIIYGLTGFTNFSDLSRLFEISVDFIEFKFLIWIAIFFITVALFFKLAIPPFHIWLADIYEGSSKFLLLIFVLLPKISVIIFLWKIYYILLLKINLQNFFLIFIILSWIIGVIGGVRSLKFSRLIAYSSINQMGFILLAIIINNITCLTIYLICYLFSLFCFLLIWLNLIHWSNYKSINLIDQITFLVKSNYTLFWLFVLSVFSLAGIPPLLGFFGKFFLFYSSLEFNYYLFVIIGILITVISYFYYLRIIKNIFFINNKYWFFLKPLSRKNSYIIILLFVINITILLFFPIVFEFLNYILL